MLQPIDIKALRKKLKMTQTEFAAAIGTDQGTVSAWEKGHHKPGKMARTAIERLLGTDASGVAA